MEKSYRVVFEGKILENKKLQDVKGKLVPIIGERNFEKAVSSGITLKKEATKEQAYKIKNKFNSLGAECYIIENYQKNEIKDENINQKRESIKRSQKRITSTGSFIASITNWIFGIFFLLIGILFVYVFPLAGLCLIVIAMLLLPPIRKLAYSKTNKAFSLKYRGISIFILLIVFVFLVIDYGEKSERKLAEQKAREKAQKEEQIRKRNIEYFIENRNQIISSLSKSFSLQDYQKVIDESSKYVSSGDKEIKNLNKKASDALLQIKKAEKAAKEKAIRVEKTQELIAKLKNIPDSHYQANKTIYTQLAKLNPDNEQYKSKLEYFVQKIEEQEKQNKLERARKEMERVKRIKRFGEPPKKSSWNDSYLSVKWYLEEKAHDPDSLEIDSCTELYYTEDGWLVGCNYRGRNAFGAIVRQSNWFTIVHDKVVKVHDASAYNP